MSGSEQLESRQEHAAPENWEYIGSSEYGNGGERFQNDCVLWLVVEGDKVVTWVGNFHIAVRGTEKEVGRFEDETSAKEAAFEWMEENPTPWVSHER